MPATERRQRTPAIKFVKRRFTKKRLKRIGQVHLKEDYVRLLFAAADHFLSRFGSGNSTVIFIGQRMRSMFEVTRAINEIEMKRPRREIKYFITPGAEYLRDIANTPELDRLTEGVARKLEKRRTVTRNKNTYYVVDYKYGGHTLGLLKNAIRKINPKAKIVIVDQGHPLVGTAISETPEVAPTRKDKTGTKLSASTEEKRTSFLRFQYLVQALLAERKRGK